MRGNVGKVTYHILEAQTVWVAGRDGGVVLVWQETARLEDWEAVKRVVVERGVRQAVVCSASGELQVWGEYGHGLASVWEPGKGWKVGVAESRRLVKLGETYPEVYAGRGVVAGS